MRDEDFTASRLFYAFTFVVASSFTLPGGGFLISSSARLTMSTCGDLVYTIVVTSVNTNWQSGIQIIHEPVVDNHRSVEVKVYTKD